MKTFTDKELEKRRRWSKTQSRFDPKNEERDRMDTVETWPVNSQLKALVKRDGLYCCWCGTLCDPRSRPNADLFPTREHVIRLSDGGRNHMDNLKVSCRKCNNSRHGRSWKPVHHWLGGKP